MTEKALRAIQLMPTMTNSMIAREVGLTPERIRQLRNETGIEGPKWLHCSISWTDEKIAKLCRIDLPKYTSKELSYMLDVATNTLLTKIHELELDIPKDGSLKYTKEFIRSLYFKHNGHIVLMAEELGVAVPGITRECSKYGLKGRGRGIRRRGKRCGGNKKWTKELIKPLWEKHNGDQKAIAAELEIPKGSVWHVFKYLGLHAPKQKRTGGLK